MDSESYGMPPSSPLGRHPTFLPSLERSGSAQLTDEALSFIVEQLIEASTNMLFDRSWPVVPVMSYVSQSTAVQESLLEIWDEPLYRAYCSAHRGAANIDYDSFEDVSPRHNLKPYGYSAMRARPDGYGEGFDYMDDIYHDSVPNLDQDGYVEGEDPQGGFRSYYEHTSPQDSTYPHYKQKPQSTGIRGPKASIGQRARPGSGDYPRGQQHRIQPHPASDSQQSSQQQQQFHRPESRDYNNSNGHLRHNQQNDYHSDYHSNDDVFYPDSQSEDYRDRYSSGVQDPRHPQAGVAAHSGLKAVRLLKGNSRSPDSDSSNDNEDVGEYRNGGWHPHQPDPVLDPPSHPTSAPVRPSQYGDPRGTSARDPRQPGRRDQERSSSRQPQEQEGLFIDEPESFVDLGPARASKPSHRGSTTISKSGFGFRKDSEALQAKWRKTPVSKLSLTEIEDEKRSLKKQLKALDEQFEDEKGRAPRKEDKEHLRPLYERYFKLKKAITKLSTVGCHPRSTAQHHNKMFAKESLVV